MPNPRAVPDRIAATPAEDRTPRQQEIHEAAQERAELQRRQAEMDAAWSARAS